jgi:hypothetical protein
MIATYIRISYVQTPGPACSAGTSCQEQLAAVTAYTTKCHACTYIALQRCLLFNSRLAEPKGQVQHVQLVLSGLRDAVKVVLILLHNMLHTCHMACHVTDELHDMVAAPLWQQKVKKVAARHVCWCAPLHDARQQLLMHTSPVLTRSM